MHHTITVTPTVLAPQGRIGIHLEVTLAQPLTAAQQADLLESVRDALARQGDQIGFFAIGEENVVLEIDLQVR